MTQNIKIVEYLKTGISVQTHIGCPICCKYCIVPGFYDGMEKVKQLSEVENAINTLIKYKYFDKSVPIMINNKTESFQPKVVKHTFELLSELKKRNIKNPKLLITKLPIPIKYIDVLQDNNIFIFTTYSGMPSYIEPTSNPKNLQEILETNRFVKQNSDAKLIHYWRPIVRNVNSHINTIRQIITDFNEVFDSSVISGIRLTPNIKAFMESVGANFLDWNKDINHKFLPEDILNLITKERDKIAPNYKLFTKTSCSISHLLGEHDYNLNFAKKNYSCVLNCPNGNNCNGYEPNVTPYTYEMIDRSEISHIATINNGIIYIQNDISQEAKSFLTQTTALRIIADNTSKSETERLFNERNGRSL